MEKYEKYNAIVLSSTKYSDNSLIVRCFTPAYGTCSYLLKGVLSPKKKFLKAALFQPFTQLELVATHKDTQQLGYIKEAKIAHPYHSLHTDIYKSTICIFLAEICTIVCPAGTPDAPLFNFLAKQLQLFDQSPFNPHFVLKFLIRLTNYLGFYPDTSQAHLPFFNIEEGIFATTETSHCISGRTLILFKDILTTDTNFLATLSSTREERNALLHQLLKYYQWHYPNFKKIKSLEVLQTLFQ